MGDLSRRVEISVGIPTYSEEENISDLLEAILRQRLPENYSIREIIVSDSSADNTYKILMDFRAKHPFMRLFHHERRTGLNYAINEIFETVRAPFLWYINADVIPAHDALYKLIDPMTRSEIVGASSGRLVPVTGHKFNIAEVANTFGAELLHRLSEKGLYHFHGTMFAIRSEIARDVRIPRHAVEQDAFIGCQTMDLGYTLLYVPDAICYYAAFGSVREQIRTSKTYRRGFRQWASEHPDWDYRYRLDQLGRIDPWVLRTMLNLLGDHPGPGALWSLTKALEVIYPIGRERKVLAKSTKRNVLTLMKNRSPRGYGLSKHRDLRPLKEEK